MTYRSKRTNTVRLAHVSIDRVLKERDLFLLPSSARGGRRVQGCRISLFGPAELIVDSLTTSGAGKSIFREGKSGFFILSRSDLYANKAKSLQGWWIVVRGGVINEAHLTSSKPASITSSGVRNLNFDSKVLRSCAAMKSDSQITASGRPCLRIKYFFRIATSDGSEVMTFFSLFRQPELRTPSRRSRITEAQFGRIRK